MITLTHLNVITLSGFYCIVIENYIIKITTDNINQMLTVSKSILYNNYLIKSALECCQYD